MNFQKHQFCLCQITLGAVNYPRPCVIVDIAPDGTLAILPVSTKHYSNASTFMVNELHQDFSATGLDTTSYIFDGPVRDIAPTGILKILGCLCGDLKKEFINWIGE